MVLAQPQDVLNKMKTEASDSTSGTVVGFSGSFVDRRIRAVLAEAADSEQAARCLGFDNETLPTCNHWSGRCRIRAGRTTRSDGERRSQYIARLLIGRQVGLGLHRRGSFRATPDTGVVTTDVLPSTPTSSGGSNATQLPSPCSPFLAAHILPKTSQCLWPSPFQLPT